jgi:hypothetical protein
MSRKTFIKLISFLFFSLVFLAKFPEPILADTCATRPTGGNHAISDVCSFPNSNIDGVDSGTGTTNTAILTISAGGSLSILNGQTIATGSIDLTSGTITIIDGGAIKLNTPLYMTDADGDTYPLNTTQYTSPDTNLVRRNTIDSSLAIDCNDGNGTIFAGSTWYFDSDSDTYGNPSISTTACTQPANYVSNNTDCYDSNASAKPGQTTCFTTNRGDGSFDYNCDSSQSACNSCNTSSSSSSYYWRQCSGGYCWTDPYNQTFTGYTCSGSTSTCGAGGVTCTGGKYSSCVYNPCSLYDAKATGTTGCTVSCR